MNNYRRKPKSLLNLRINLVLIVLWLLSSSCISQNKIILDYPYAEEFTSIYYGHNMDLAEEKKQEYLEENRGYINIAMYSSYDDSLIITVNDYVIFDATPVLLSENGHERSVFRFKKKSFDSSLVIMRIYSTRQKTKTEIVVDTRIPCMELSYSKKGWSVDYVYSIGGI